MRQPETLLQLIAAVRADSTDPFLLAPDLRAIATYGDAARRSAQIANALRHSGVGVGDRVALKVAKSPEALMVYLACVRSGAVLVPMNTGYTAAEVAHLVGDAEPTPMFDNPVVDDGGLGQLGWLADQMDTSFVDHVSSPHDLAAVLYTSGTTGRPKGAMLSHRNLASNSSTLHQQWGFRPGDVLLHALPIFHTHGLFVATNCSILNGSPMLFLERFDIDQVVESLPLCTVMMGVPTYYTRLLDDARVDRATCAQMRLFISGSAPLLASVHDEFRSRTGHAILERYGMTETSMLTSNPLDGERRAGTVGMALADVDVRVVDDDGDEQAAGAIGAIEVRGPNVFAGYWRRPELAAEFTVDGYFRTGDVGRFDDDGYLHIVGRSKDLIISGGLNVYPKEIEDVLDAIDGVLESAVIGVADRDFGEAVAAVVVLRRGASIDGDQLRAIARRQLAAFKVPKRVFIVDALPRNAMGKIAKASLRTEYANAPARQRSAP